jgi:hypothetical protein
LKIASEFKLQIQTKINFSHNICFTTYTANSIAELPDSQIQTIIDYFSKNPNTELYDDQDALLSISSDNDQNNTSEVRVSTAPILLTHVSGDSQIKEGGVYYDEGDYYEDDDTYDEVDKGYYYRNGRKVSPMTSPIISPVLQ